MSVFETSLASGAFEGGFSSLEARSAGVVGPGPLDMLGILITVFYPENYNFITGNFYPDYLLEKAQYLAALDAFRAASRGDVRIVAFHGPVPIFDQYLPLTPDGWIPPECTVIQVGNPDFPMDKSELGERALAVWGDPGAFAATFHGVIAVTGSFSQFDSEHPEIIHLVPDGIWPTAQGTFVDGWLDALARELIRLRQLLFP